MPANTAIANALTEAVATAAADENPEVSIDILQEVAGSTCATMMQDFKDKTGAPLKAAVRATFTHLGELAWDIHKFGEGMPVVDAVLYVMQTSIKDMLPALIEQFNPKAEIKGKSTVCHLIELTAPLMKAMENLDEYSQARMLQNIGRGFINAVGWNRAFYENVLYGSYEAARNYQAESPERDDDGVFIGAYSPEELDDMGRPITSLRDQLSPNQQLLLEELELKEELMWDAFNAAKEGFTDIQGSKTPFITPSRQQRQDGIRTLEQMVEDQKQRSIDWHLEQERVEAQRQAARRRALSSATRVSREAKNRMLNEALV